MRSCKGLHCDGCHHGSAGAGAGIGALVVLIGVLELAAHHRAVGHAASDAAHIAIDVLVMVTVTLTAVAVTVAGVRLARRRAAARRLDAGRRAVLPLRAWVIQPPQAAARPAIESGQRHQAQRALPRWLGQARDAAARRERSR
jgi:hypothetical protein